MNPYTDYGFKKLFGTKENKDFLISFLNALLEGKENTITDVNYTDLEELDSIAGRRVSYFDIITWDKQINNVYLFCIVSTNPYTKRHKQNTCYNESQLTDVVNDHILYKKLTYPETN